MHLESNKWYIVLIFIYDIGACFQFQDGIQNHDFVILKSMIATSLTLHIIHLMFHIKSISVAVLEFQGNRVRIFDH